MDLDQRAIDEFNTKHRQFFKMIASTGTDVQLALHEQFPLPCFLEASGTKQAWRTTPGLDTTVEAIQEATQQAALLAITHSRSPLKIALIPAISLALQQHENPRYANKILRGLEVLKLIQHRSFSALLHGNRPTRLVVWEITNKGRAKLQTAYRPSDLDMLRRLAFDDQKNQEAIFCHLMLAYHARLRGGRVIFAPTLDGGYVMSIGFGTAQYRIVTPYSTEDALAHLRKNLTGCRLGACAGNNPMELVNRLRKLGLYGVYTTITALWDTQNDVTSPLWTGRF